MSFELNRRLVARRPALDTDATIDAVTAGIINGAFETVCFEVATHLGRAASSAIINQSNERNASIIDANGRLAAVSVGIPQLLFVSPLAVRWGLENFAQDDWGPGDVFVGNDPDYGGGHLPDYTVYAPAVRRRRQAGLIQALQAHQGDTGGKDPGGFSVDSTRYLWRGPRHSRAETGAPRPAAARRDRPADSQQPLSLLCRRYRGHDQRRAGRRQVAAGTGRALRRGHGKGRGELQHRPDQRAFPPGGGAVAGRRLSRRMSGSTRTPRAIPMYTCR